MDSLAYYVTVLRKDFSEYCGERLQEVGVTQGLLYFIIYVGKHPGCSPGELSGALHMDSGHAARSLAKLVQGGFLRQEKSTQDKRVHILWLEEKGKAVFRLSYELFTEWDKRMMAEMTDEERKQLLGLFSRLKGHGRGNYNVSKHI